MRNHTQKVFGPQEREETKSLLMRWLKRPCFEGAQSAFAVSFSHRSEVLRVDVNLSLTGTCLAKHHLLQLVVSSEASLGIGDSEHSKRT